LCHAASEKSEEMRYQGSFDKDVVKYLYTDLSSGFGIFVWVLRFVELLGRTARRVEHQSEKFDEDG
jgi:hypothetical protein